MYNARAFDAVGIRGLLERNPEGPQDFAAYLEPVNHIAKQLHLARGSDTFFVARDDVLQFLARQLYQIFTHHLYAFHITAELVMLMHIRQCQRPATWSILSSDTSPILRELPGSPVRGA